MPFIKTRFLLIAIIAAVASIGFTATTGAQSETPPQQEAPVPASAPTPQPTCATPKEHKRAIKSALRFSAIGGNFVARKKQKSVRAAADMRACAKSFKPDWYKVEKKAWRARKREYRFYAKIDAITPYGKWAIPPAIVNCESASSGFWKAANRSGAVGPYQLLGWGAPYPVRTVAQMARHHMIAARVWAGGHGRSNWVCKG